MQTLRSTSAVSRVAARTSVKVSAILKTTKGKTTKGSAPAPQGEGKEYLLTLPGQGLFGLTSDFWDPLKLADSPTLTVSEAKRYREAELTHGRVAMLAALGWVIAEEYHPLFNGDGGYSSFARFQKVESDYSWFAEVLVFGIGLCESYRISRGWNDPRDVDQIKEEYIPGDLGFDPLGLKPKDDDALFDMETKELAHGRLAMIAIVAFAAQEDVEKDHSIWSELVERDIIPPREAALFPEFQ